MDYHRKYLKYKEKYFNLKNQHGSGTELVNIETNRIIRGLFGRTVDLIFNSSRGMDPKVPRSEILSKFNHLKKLYNDDVLLEELKILNYEELTVLLKNENINLIKNFLHDCVDKNIVNDTNIHDVIGTGLLKLVNSDLILKKVCSSKELMTVPDPAICNNPTLVTGSCAVPSFFQSIHNINYNNEKIIEFFDLLSKNNTRHKNIVITLGSRMTIDGSSHINITFNEGREEGKELDYYIRKLRDGELQNIYHINNYFPLNTDGSNKDVLDKILAMTAHSKISIINKICGSCFRSFYYLVQNATTNFDYSVNPEQGLGIQDSAEIQNCFKA